MNISNQPHQVFVRPGAFARQPHIVQTSSQQISNTPAWHNILPGDQYDIKKYFSKLFRSMIATLKSENRFMGDNL
jgi:hypothetical protein